MGTGFYGCGQWSVCVCVQSVVVTQLVPRRCQVTHWAAVVHTLMVNVVSGLWSVCVCVCVCVQSVAVTQLVPRRCQVTHWAAVVHTLMVSCVSVKTEWLDASVTLVSLATGTCVSTTLAAVKVRNSVQWIVWCWCKSVDRCVVKRSHS